MKNTKEILRKIRKKFRAIGKRIGIMDDFDWSGYYREYSKEISEMENKHTLILPDGKYSVINKKIILDSVLLPLHNNHKILYETVYVLNPYSILEVGCGWGDHLVNIKKLLPEVGLNGSEISQKQLEFLFQRHPELKNQATLLIQDITNPKLKAIKVDLVFTQAVLMHIQRYKHYLSALRNIFRSAEKWIVLMERWDRHNYVEDIKKISQEPDFPWKNLYFYTNDTGKQMLLVVSQKPLSRFKEIKNTKQLLKHLKQKNTTLSA